ncbi:Saccharopine dehydrogenase [NADP(+), L-glutamate-forming] [Schaereria dolodes]|nr:Saccharopine dehydrogenase [NADP(+), L-glutamate-forming] [Schaereria dolodes]
MTPKKVLLLGAGFVTKPTVQILSDADIEVTVACRTLESAKKLSRGIKNVQAISLDVTDSTALDAEVKKVDIVVSLIPYTFHATVIKSAIRERKNCVTTSYISPAMLELEKDAKAAGITVMNEIGLDPGEANSYEMIPNKYSLIQISTGIDHLWAVKTIDEVHRSGGKINSFVSYCGGLPAPEASDNPLGYKFSWSPRGVLLLYKNSARFYKAGSIEEVPGPDLLKAAKPYFIYPGFNFCAHPNRDSTPFMQKYNIPEAETIIRGTLRYQCFPALVRVLVDIGFLSEDKHDFLSQSISWKEATQKILCASSEKESDLEWAISSKTDFANNDDKNRVLAGLRWIGLFSDDTITPRGTPLDTLCATLEQKMQYEPDERDMVMLQHKFEIEHKDGRKETRTSTLVEYGDPNGYSAMAKLVGIPCGIAVKQVLDGTISQKGILAPYTPEINNPLMEELKKYGIELKEQTVA